MIILTYNGKSLNQRPENNYVNLSQLCATHGKKLNNWTPSKLGKSYLEALSARTQKSVLELIDTTVGGHGGSKTWGHLLAAIGVARWVSTEFGLWCNEHIKTLIETGTTTITDNAEIKSFLINIQEENRQLRQENQQIQQSIFQILDAIQKLQTLDTETTAKEIAQKAEEKLDEYHGKKALEFKRIRERNEINKYLRRNR
ncbi:KilA-N domain-containing protein [Crocosphaera sp. Alani8]|uniref:KilA-N domain-containing protein n=1 Tax=Crocosphaera sp. Alani8 TaxID=3038952 RepID=UPI00313C30C1